MKKTHHIDITKVGCSPDDIKKDLQDFYSSLLKYQEKRSIIKIKNKAKVTKMISNICTMVQNNSSNINPYLDELSNIFIFLVSPNVDDFDVRNDSINCLFLIISLLEGFDKDYLMPIIESLFSISSEADKKQKSSKKLIITSIFTGFIKQMKTKTELDRKKIWLQIIFFCIFPTLKQTKQLDPAIIPECSYYCMEAITKIVSKATDYDTMDYFLKEENSFFIFESASLLKNLYKYSDDRRFAILFYSRIFPCTFYYTDLDLSARKFEKKDDMNQILQSRRYSGWGGPNLLASFNSEPRPFFYRIIDLALNSKRENIFINLLEPMLEAMCCMLNQIKDSKDIEMDIIDLYFIIMRLRNVIKLSYQACSSKSLVDSSFTCLIMYITQMNQTYKEYFPLFLSFYLTTLFDSKFVNIHEVRNFVKSIINLSSVNESAKSNVMQQISVHVVALMTIAISPFLLDIPNNQRMVFLTNAMEMKISLKPLSLALMRRITTNNIYFFLQIIGCNFSEIISRGKIESPASLPTESNMNNKEKVNTQQINANSADQKNLIFDSNLSSSDSHAENDETNKKNTENWTKESASKFILDLIEAIDSNVCYVVSATVADVLVCILKETSNSNPDFVFGKILPILFYNALNMKPEIPVFLPILRKIIHNAYRYGYLNIAMSHDWFRVVQKYILSIINQDYENELIFGIAQSIIRGYPMSLSMIPIFIVLVNNIINPDSSLIDADSREEISNIVFTKHILLICTCLVDISIIMRNNPAFSSSNVAIDPSMKNYLAKIFNNNEAFICSFENMISSGGIRKKCILLLKHICSTMSPTELKNVENLILLLLFSELNNSENNENEEINNIIESILINNFLNTDRFLGLSLEFYHLLTLLIQYFNQVMKKFPNLISTIIYTISMVFVEKKEITIHQYTFLLRFVTNLAIVKESNTHMYQCLNIISLPTNIPDRNLILNHAFNTFVHDFRKKTGVINLKFDNIILLNDSETIYSVKFNYKNSDNKINSLAVQTSHEGGSTNYILKFKNNFLKERPNLNYNSDNENSNDANKANKKNAKANFNIFREFILYPSTAIFFELLSEADNTIIKGASKNPYCTSIAKKAFMRDQHSFINSGIIFIGNNQIHKEEFLLNGKENVSKTFYRFLTSIGKLYKPTKIPFLIDDSEKTLDELKNDEAVLCWSDNFHKVVYSVSILSNYSKDDRFVQRWKRFKEKKFLVFWSENAKQLDFFAEGFLSEGKLEYAFIVKPYNKDMATLTVFQKRNNLPVFGFFKKSLILPFDLIGFVISSMLILDYDMNKQLHSLPFDEFKQYKDLYENKLDDDTIMFKP